MNIKEEIYNHEQEIISHLSKLISYPSIYQKDDTPFGIQNKKCLEEALKIADSYGLKTVNLDDYCGYVEIGEGSEIIGVLAHLDVVPAGNGWNTEPFQLTIKDNKMYGRGVSDDKGAVVAMLFVMNLLKKFQHKLNKRVRLILGCNEECGSHDIEYYIKKEGNISMGFTPDGSFPVIHGEKGRILLSFSTSNTKIIDMIGGQSDNAVPDYVKFKINNNSYQKKQLENDLKINNLHYKITQNSHNHVIEVYGKASHASTPEKGKNAISYAIMALYHAGYEDEFIKNYVKYIGTSFDGKNLNIKCSDEYGSLTCNQGMLKKENDKMIGTIDIRVPVTYPVEQILKQLQTLKIPNWTFRILDVSPSLFYPIDHPLVHSLQQAYIKVTGDENTLPITTGGGTYAKSIDHCVAFGCAFPDTFNHIHQANEVLLKEELWKQIEIYYIAICNLLKI